jgi:hypothetical protein
MGRDTSAQPNLPAQAPAPTSPAGSPATGTDLPPLHRSRIEAWLGANGFTYFTDSDGDLGGLWNGRLFYFLVLGVDREVLQVRGQWNRDATVDRVPDLLDLCNRWNSDRIWPKAYLRVRDDGGVIVCADMTVDVEHGLTDDQLDQLLQCGLATGGAFFDELDGSFPDPLRGQG